MWEFPVKVFVKLYGAVVARMRAHNLLNIEVYYIDSIESIDGRDSPLYIHINNIDFKACIRIRHTHKSNNST